MNASSSNPLQYANWLDDLNVQFKADSAKWENKRDFVVNEKPLDFLREKTIYGGKLSFVMLGWQHCTKMKIDLKSVLLE